LEHRLTSRNQDGEGEEQYTGEPLEKIAHPSYGESDAWGGSASDPL